MSPPTIILAVTCVIYFLVVGNQEYKPIRYFAPMVPLYAVLVARLFANLRAGPSHAIRTVATAGCILVLVFTGSRTLALVSVYRHEDTRITAARYVQDHVPDGSHILFQRGHNSLIGLVSHDRYTVELMDLEGFAIKAKNEALVAKGDYAAVLEQEHLAHADLLLLTDERLAMNHTRAAVLDFNTRLSDRTLGFESLVTFDGGLRLFGFRFSHPDRDLSWEQFDHPTTFLFARVGNPTLYAAHPELSVYGQATWQDAYTVFARAIEQNEFSIFRLRTLSHATRSAYDPDYLFDVFQHLRANPDLVRNANGPDAFALEDGVYRLKLVLEP